LPSDREKNAAKMVVAQEGNPLEKRRSNSTHHEDREEALVRHSLSREGPSTSRKRNPAHPRKSPNLPGEEKNIRLSPGRNREVGKKGVTYAEPGCQERAKIADCAKAMRIVGKEESSRYGLGKRACA